MTRMFGLVCASTGPANHASADAKFGAAVNDIVLLADATTVEMDFGPTSLDQSC